MPFPEFEMDFMGIFTVSNVAKFAKSVVGEDEDGSAEISPDPSGSGDFRRACEASVTVA